MTQATKNDNKVNVSSNDGSKKQEIPNANSTTIVTNCPNCSVEGRAPWMKIALEEYRKYKGIKETVNPLADRVREYHKIGSSSPKFGPDKPWCASFVNWVLKQAKVKNWGTASSQGPITDKQKRMKKIDIPVYGAIIMLTNYQKGTMQSIGQGHVTFLYGETEDGKHYIGLGGNQGDSITLGKFKKTGISYSSKTFDQRFVALYLPSDYVIKESDKLTKKDIYPNDMSKIDKTR